MTYECKLCYMRAAVAEQLRCARCVPNDLRSPNPYAMRLDEPSVAEPVNFAEVFAANYVPIPATEPTPFSGGDFGGAGASGSWDYSSPSSESSSSSCSDSSSSSSDSGSCGGSE